MGRYLYSYFFPSKIGITRVGTLFTENIVVEKTKCIRCPVSMVPVHNEVPLNFKEEGRNLVICSRMHETRHHNVK